MAGWDKKEGLFRRESISDYEIWSMFNKIFSTKSVKRTSYKFGLLKSILDNISNVNIELGYLISYYDLFSRFTKCYWDLIVKYELRQIRPDNKGSKSGIEKIFIKEIEENAMLDLLDFELIETKKKNDIIKKVEILCKKYVMGALLYDSDYLFYDFKLDSEGIYLNPQIYRFLLKHKMEIDRMNYYEWARFLEKNNNDKIILDLFDKIKKL